MVSWSLGFKKNKGPSMRLPASSRLAVHTPQTWRQRDSATTEQQQHIWGVREETANAAEETSNDRNSLRPGMRQTETAKRAQGTGAYSCWWGRHGRKGDRRRHQEQQTKETEKEKGRDSRKRDRRRHQEQQTKETGKETEGDTKRQQKDTEKQRKGRRSPPYIYGGF